MTGQRSAIKIQIDGLKFSWDENKAHANERKHGVTFEEAASCWLDPFKRETDDPLHSINEPRQLLIGVSKFNRLLVCWFTERNLSQEEIIRLIGARKASPNERKEYEEESL
jgi:uncharacterized DUF497 family protein